MKKETLIKHLDNVPLVSALKEKREIDSYTVRLGRTLQLFDEVKMSDAATDEANTKLKEYQKISAGYDRLIETVFGLSCWDQAIVDRFINCDFVELQELPSEIK